MFDRAGSSGNPGREKRRFPRRSEGNGSAGRWVFLLWRGPKPRRLVRFRCHAISRARETGAAALHRTSGPPFMLSSFRKGGVIQFLMGGVIVAIIIAFMLDYRRSGMKRSFHSECAVEVGSTCVAP